MPSPAPLRAADFWSREASVQSLVHRDRTERYETDLLAAAVEVAGGRSAVGRVGVVGVGAGRELGTVVDLTSPSSVVGWDIAAPMVDACRRRIAAAGWDGVTAEVGAVADVSDHEPFDLLIGLNAALCYPQPATERTRSLVSMHRMLRPGGAIALVVQQRFGRPDWALWFLARRLAHAVSGRPAVPTDHRSVLGDVAVDVHHYTRTEITQLLAGVGFVSTEVRSLRAWAREAGHPVPLRSSNPLLVISRR